MRRVLAARRNSFEALSAPAWIEVKFQNYPAAAELYEQALAVQVSPAPPAAPAQPGAR
ncbi:MAG TPA: hypothetical protein VGS58_07355 [Candidatus Sulfopaludibacter sp.]|nr:hypothetical protein [Candidatus Sulfopaludibacter sp.]